MNTIVIELSESDNDASTDDLFCIAVYDYQGSRYRVFLEDNIHELMERVSLPNTLICGFNLSHIWSAFNRLNHPPKSLNEIHQYDLWVESKKRFSKSTEHCFSHLWQRFGSSKVDFSPIKFGGTVQMINGCLHLVGLKKQVFERMWTNEDSNG